MAHITPKTTVDHMIDMAFHTGVGAGVGAIAAKYVVPLALNLQQGAIVGAALGTASGLIQKAAHAATGMEETALSKAGITAATLGLVFFGATTYPAQAGMLLGRVGLELTKDTMMKLFVGTLIGEVALAAITQQFFGKVSTDDVVAKYSKEEMEKALVKFDERVKADYKPGEGDAAPIPAAFATAIEKRLVTSTDADIKGLVKAPATNKDAKDLQEVEVRVLFARGDEIPAPAKGEFVKRVEALNLFTIPAKKEDVEGLSSAQLKWAFTYYMRTTDKMAGEVKTALNEAIEKAGLVTKPTKEDEAKGMSKPQLFYAYNNMTEFTTGMDDKIVQALENAIISNGIMVSFKKPTNEAEAKAFTNRLQLKALYKAHDALMKDADRATIIALNTNYKAVGLTEKKVPAVKAPELTTMQKVGKVYTDYTPTFVQNHIGKIGGVVGTTLGGVAVDQLAYDFIPWI